MFNYLLGLIIIGIGAKILITGKVLKGALNLDGAPQYITAIIFLLFGGYVLYLQYKHKKNMINKKH